VLGFFSSRPNWGPPNPSTVGERVPPSLVQGRGTHSLAGEGLGVPIWTMGQKLGIYALCGVSLLSIVIG
jgi:hypothetical protein